MPAITAITTENTIVPKTSHQGIFFIMVIEFPFEAKLASMAIVIILNIITLIIEPNTPPTKPIALCSFINCHNHGINYSYSCNN